jgi:hypothetical protein
MNYALKTRMEGVDMFPNNPCTVREMLCIGQIAALSTIFLECVSKSLANVHS